MPNGHRHDPIRDLNPRDLEGELAEYELGKVVAAEHKGQCRECGRWHPADLQANAIAHHGNENDRFCVGSFAPPTQTVQIPTQT